LREELGIKFATGAKILGAWVGVEGDAKAFLSKQLERTRPFFEIVAKLSPEIAVPVLSKCGIPRANYLLRTHSAHVSKAFAEAFDSMTLVGLAAILRVPRAQLEKNEDALTSIHLPLSMGGLGITSMRRIASIAYNASLDAWRKEDTALPQWRQTEQMNIDIVNCSSAGLQKHLLWGKRAGWTMSTTINPHYRQSILHHISGHTEALGRCSCGLKLPQRELVAHALGCSRLSGTNANSRHKAVKAAIFTFCNRNGIPVADEPVVNFDGITTKRADLRITLPTEDVYVDVTVANAACKTFKGKTMKAIETIKRREKDASYNAYVNALGGVLVTFVAEVRGSLGDDAVSLCKRLTALTIMKGSSTLVVGIQSVLARYNGAIIQNVLRPVVALMASE
jgi:hypothetical protein